MLEMAAPTLLGIAAIVLFNVVDTFWVGKIGAAELAAMTFTFPVVMIVFSVSMGIGIGTTAVIARALGHGGEDEVRRLTTDALLLANATVIVLALLGLATINPLFRLLGADESTLVLIRQYMVPWYLGVGLLVIPMVGNSALRATGDTKTPSFIMLTAALVNAVLDPFLIFGWGPFPQLGLTGAALSTVASYAGAFVVAIWVLAKRERLIAFERPRLVEVLKSWRRILYIGLPAAATNMLAPVSAGLLTRMVAEYGELSVAAYGVGTRIEGLATIGLGALSTAVTPFVAQNLGAGKCDRIREAIRFGVKAALVWGACVALLLAVVAKPISAIFNSEAEVVDSATAYLLFVPLSYGMLGVAQLVGTSLNALNKPLQASSLVGTRLVVLAVPLALLGAHFAGLHGLFAGIAAANLSIGFLALAVVRRQLEHVEAVIDSQTIAVPV
ncbi:MAG: putative MATE family efflux protein [Bradymonadia bacterium]|jgi:putative MATE family efflux protein